MSLRGCWHRLDKAPAALFRRRPEGHGAGMPDPFNLQRFLDAQSRSIETALAELRDGAKQSHWMWFVFPQLAALGRSGAAKLYGIETLAQARAYLDHPVLGARLRECVEAALPWAGHRS